MKTRILFILLVGLGLQAVGQQQILYQTTQTKSWLLSYSSSGEESQKVINEMLDAIATYIPKPVYQTKITFNVEENIKITREKNKVSVFVTHLNVNLTGDIYYKTFNMTDVLVPSKYEFSGTLSRTKGVFLADFTQPRTNFNYPYSEVILQYEDTSAASSYVFVLNSTSFYYDNVSRSRFRDKVTLIDQYFTADLDMNKIKEQLNTINPDAFEVMDNNMQLLNDLKRNTDNISAAAFWQGLHIENYDPLKLYSKMYDLRTQEQNLQTALDHTRSIAHQLYYDKAVDQYDHQKLTEARQNFERSLSYNPGFAPSQFFLARIAFEEKKSDEAKMQINKLFTFKNIDNDTRKSAYSLAGAIEWYDMNIAATNLNSRKYQDALAALVNAENFCKGIPGYVCNDTIELIRGDCHRGIYADYIGNANHQFALKKYNEAEVEINKAIDYQRQYQKYITDNKEALAIKEKIKIEQYYVAMRLGKDKMDAKDYRAAFSEFKKASDIEALYPVTKDRQLPELLKRSKLEVMLMDLAEAEKLVMANDLTRAREILRTAIEEQKIYGLLDNQKLSQKIENLRKSIFSQECANAQKAYDDKISEASTAVADKDFIKAELLYAAAIQIAESNHDCGIGNELAMKGKSSVANPAQYQRLMNQCNELARGLQYGQAIDAYNKLTTFYNTNNIQSSGLVHPALEAYINTFETGFLLYGIDWFINSNNFDPAIFLIKQVRQRNLPKNEAKLQQRNLGRALAIRDMQKDPGMNPKIKVTEYTLGDKWYAVFTKEYIKQAKKMK
jgi:hypothetical protein